MDELKNIQNVSSAPDNINEPTPEIEVPALRTYKNDINQTVHTDKITTAKVLMAEQRAQEKNKTLKQQSSVTKPTNFFALFFGILFIVAALGGVGYFLYTKKFITVPNISITSDSFFLFAFDKHVYVDATKSKPEIFSFVKNTFDEALQDKDNTYTDLIFYKKDNDTQIQLNSAQLFELYDIRLPSVIALSISKDYTYGIYKTGARAEPFLVIGLVDYEHAYDAMFDWENTLATDMRGFFPNLQKIYDQKNPPIVEPIYSTSSSTTATTSSTSTNSTKATTTIEEIEMKDVISTSTLATSSSEMPPVATTTFESVVNRNMTFTDVVLSNNDTRTIRDSNGAPYFYYTFIDKDKILFAQDPKLITEIVRKMKEKQLIR